MKRGSGVLAACLYEAPCFLTYLGLVRVHAHFCLDKMSVEFLCLDGPSHCLPWSCIAMTSALGHLHKSTFFFSSLPTFTHCRATSGFSDALTTSATSFTIEMRVGIIVWEAHTINNNPFVPTWSPQATKGEQDWQAIREQIVRAGPAYYISATQPPHSASTSLEIITKNKSLSN